MKGKYLRRIGGLTLAALMLVGIAFVSPTSVAAQRRGRRVVIVRPFPHRIYRPFGWGYYPWGYYPYDMRYSQYVFEDSDRAGNQGYKDGYKTGEKDGKKDKSYDPQRSHYYRDSGFGNFAEIYRSGFSRGYEDGYRVGGNGRAG